MQNLQLTDIATQAVFKVLAVTDCQHLVKAGLDDNERHAFLRAYSQFSMINLGIAFSHVQKQTQAACND